MPNDGITFLLNVRGLFSAVIQRKDTQGLRPFSNQTGQFIALWQVVPAAAQGAGRSGPGPALSSRHMPTVTIAILADSSRPLADFKVHV